MHLTHENISLHKSAPRCFDSQTVAQFKKKTEKANGDEKIDNFASSPMAWLSFRRFVVGSREVTELSINEADDSTALRVKKYRFRLC